MQIRRMVPASVLEQSRVTNPDGSRGESYTVVANYPVIVQELTDEVSVATYGANVSKMIRISSPRENLAKWLKTRNNDTPDNISKYRIMIEGYRYKIVSVKTHWVDLIYE